MALPAGRYGLPKRLLNKLLGLPTTEEIADEFKDVYKVMGVNGAKNLWKIINKTGLGTGITFTSNSDGSVTMSAGTATSECKYPTETDNLLYSGEDLKPSTNYIVSIGTASAGVSIQAYYKATQDSSYTALFGVSGVSEYSFTTPATFYSMWFRIRIDNGTTVSETTFYPMIRLATDTDDTFVPYAMTNRQLTTSKANASALGTVENGTNASKSYAAGEHFSRFSNFCTVTQPIASNDTLTENTNYIVGNIGDLLATTLLNLSKHADITILQNESKKFGNIVSFRIQFQVTNDIADRTDIFTCSSIAHPQYGVCEAFNSNTGSIIPILVGSSLASVPFNCRAAIPTGYYVLNYTFII